MAPELLDAVFRSPDDDAPRRVLAESLQRAGDPRGEFIALQLDTQRIFWSDTNLGGLRRVEVDAAVIERMTALFRKHRRAWFDGTRKRLNAMGVARGFVELGEAGVEKFLVNADAVFAAEPLRALTLTTPKKGAWPTLAAASWWSRLRSAYVGTLKPGAAELTKLLANAGFTALRHLSLAGAPLGADGAAALAAAPFTQLEHLELGVTGVPHGAVAALVGAPWFAKLRAAELANNPVYGFDAACPPATAAERAQIIDALCALPPGLTMLSLPCAITDHDLARLGAAPIATSLRSLEVAPSESVTADAIAAFNAARAEPIALSGFPVTHR
jgi:uncharacterized protein (TIGR02996 family)